MDDRQLIADLLSALEYHTEQTRPIEFSKVAIQAAREYLQKPEQPAQQEPFGYGRIWWDAKMFVPTLPSVRDGGWLPLYTSPPAQRTWVGLTDEEFQMIYDMGRTPAGMMEMVEAKLKEKNT